MTYDDFEQDLRRGLATLAREAVPDDRAVVIDDLPKVQPLPSPERRVATRAMAAALVVVLVAGLLALALGRRDHTPRLQTPLPTWTQIAPFPLLARYEQSAVFTGREVIVWGGRGNAVTGVTPGATTKIPPDAFGDGAAYDVSSNSWGVLPTAPIGTRYRAVAAWTGKEMIVTGGMSDGTDPSGGIEFLQDGAAYDPAHRRWRRIPDAPGCPEFGTWTGTELVVGGNCANTTREYFIAAYDPARNRWTQLPSHTVATQLVAAAGRVFAWSADPGLRGAVLDSKAQRWTTLPPLPDGRRDDSFATAYNGHLAVVGLLQRASEARDVATVDIYDVERRTWRHYESEAVSAAVLGSELTNRPNELMWSGGLDYNRFLGPPASTRPVWSRAADSPVELAATGESLVAIGPGRYFVWGGMLASHGDGEPNRPTAQGAVLQFP